MIEREMDAGVFVSRNEAEATSRLAEMFPLHELTKITGHQDTRMLMRYYHPRPEDLARMLWKIDEPPQHQTDT